MRFRVIAFAAVTLLLPGVPAGAHAGLVKATPSPGVGIPQAPGAVVLRFSEPLNYSLSRIEVRDRNGADVGVGRTLPVEGDPSAMQRRLGLLEPGQFKVLWVTVSTLDGHTLKGSYTFGVGTSSLPNEEVQNSPVSSEGWLGLLGRFVALFGLSLWAGNVVIGARAPVAGVPGKQIRLITVVGPLLAFVGTGMSLASSAVVSSGSVASIGGVLVGSRSGQLRAGLLGTTAVAAILGTRSRLISAALAAAALLAEAASGHAAATPYPAAAVVSFTLHMAAVGVWVFAISASVLSRERVVKALSTFSPYAIGAAVVVAITGLSNAALEFNRPSELVTTAYGKTLLAKTAAFVVMASLGFTHHRRRRRIDVERRDVEPPLRFEFGAAVLALILATTLVGFPNPPREVEAAESFGGFDPILATLAKKDAVSIADGSGPFVVGLTLLPPRPGPVEFRVQVLGVEAGDGLRNARVRAAPVSEGRSFETMLKPCAKSLGCFSGRGRIEQAGAWQLEVSIASNRGPIALSESLPIPAPEGSAELERILDAMESLRTARMVEELRGFVGGEATVSRYEFRAPDAFRIMIRGADRIAIGKQAFNKEDPAAPWEAREWPDPGFSWPRRYYREFWGPAAAVRLLGTQEVDGVVMKVVTFVRPDLPAWFRLWVRTDDGLVHRQEMRAQGHLMDHTFADFNGPLTIEPPVQPGG